MHGRNSKMMWRDESSTSDVQQSGTSRRCFGPRVCGRIAATPRNVEHMERSEFAVEEPEQKNSGTLFLPSMQRSFVADRADE